MFGGTYTQRGARNSQNEYRHKEVVAKCEDILKELNPAYADSKAQNQRIDKIEAAISGVADSVRQIQQFLQSSTIKTRKE